jgi:hypothetical protein
MDYFNNYDGTFQYHSGLLLGQTFHIKITVPLKFQWIRKFVGLKRFNEIEIHSTTEKLKIMSNNRQYIKSTISLL